ncbi:hypothetical protein TSOC_013521 [Tetrabaena socialis]|uniref:Uncharacterized protein n=1 Tax=Tetrabaena socialis TaxID=47790 RepID=A0A2J7ZK49_9CHLO|nr:hypothetical protein TSOC_013521 [Tetrabaena socialis]|eukprot:PNH00648.1 hypothetical protein TSOC_013521 [Tetrabaena socialis]
MASGWPGGEGWQVSQKRPHPERGDGSVAEGGGVADDLFGLPGDADDETGGGGGEGALGGVGATGRVPTSSGGGGAGSRGGMSLGAYSAGAGAPAGAGTRATPASTTGRAGTVQARRPAQRSASGPLPTTLPQQPQQQQPQQQHLQQPHGHQRHQHQRHQHQRHQHQQQWPQLLPQQLLEPPPPQPPPQPPPPVAAATFHERLDAEGGGGGGAAQQCPPPPAASLVEAEQRLATAVVSCFVAASGALLDIVEGRLFREAGYRSFSNYVRGSLHLGVGLRQARSWVAAARFSRALPAGVPWPSCERQSRPVASLPRGAGVRAWVMALQRARASGAGSATGRLVAECAREVMQAAAGTDARSAESEPEPESGSGGGSGSESEEAGGAQLPLAPFTLSTSNEWYTPEHIMERVRALFAPGAIDLDPCSSAAANARVGALAYVDREADGLGQAVAWGGNVYINPPFGVRAGASMQGLFFERCVREYRAGRVAQAVLLLKAGVGYSWFRDVLQWPVCFVSERLSFVRQLPAAVGGELRWGAGVQNPHGSVVVYMGPSAGRFVRLFSDVGCIPGANAWAHS